MPQMIRHEVTPDSFIPGDLLLFRNREWTISSVSIRRKYASVTVDESVEPFQLTATQKYLVQRQESTGQEKYDEARDFLEMELRDNLTKAKAKLEERRKELLVEDENPSYWEFQSFCKAKTRYYLANYLTRCLVTVTGGNGPDGGLQGMLDRCDPGDLIQALKFMLPEIQREVWRKDSVSSNLWSNAQTDTEKDVKRDWFDYWNNRMAGLEMLQERIEK
jgi:hypothetical protein